jgi:putative acyl-CoA dehydrogenase
MVTNQPPPLVNYNLYSTDAALSEAVRREGADWAEEGLVSLGERLGGEEAIQWGFQANENPPVLKTHDRFGNRRDEVEFHPAWHDLMRLSLETGVHSLPWVDPRPGAHVARAAMLYLSGQNEAGHTCPVSMTYSCIPALRKEPSLAREWEPRITARHYDPRFLPAPQKQSATVGMGMTEKQGGSDVRANSTIAEPVGGGEYRLSGHKWFCSAPMCDAFLVLAQAPRGLSCFFLPRWTPDGARNPIHIQRLKSKLGNRSNASAEIEFAGVWARIIGEEGRGVAAIIEMVSHTRLDCVLGSAGLMRQALAQAMHHARHRSAFGKLLIDQPAMRQVLADLTVESEAATVLAMRLARAFDARHGDEREKSFGRLATAVSKYWVTKRAPGAVAEALECLGGNGYVEESILPRLYREAPLNSIWEGSGNVNALDVLRVVRKEPQAIDAVMAEIALAKGGDQRLDAYAGQLLQDVRRDIAETGARRIAGRIALALQGSLVVRHSPAAIADAFCASRLDGDWGHAFGTLPEACDFSGICGRMNPI